jgi:cytoskeleton protein RodZ
MGEFGAKFRQARESKELSLDDISNVTKISARMLQAIEEENFDQLPGGVFNKGFIRAYAKHLGLNSDDAVNEYLVCLRQAQIDSHAGWDSGLRPDPRPTKAKPAVTAPPKPAPRVEPPAEVDELPELQLPRAEDVRPARKEYLDEPRSGFPRTLIYVAAIIVLAAVILWMRRSRSSANAAKAAAPSVPTVVTPASAGTPAAANAAPPSSQPAAKPIVATSAAPKPVAATQPFVATSKPAPPLTTPPVNNPNQVTVEKKGDVTIRSFGAPTPKPAISSSENLTLVIRATENAWVSVTSDGQLVAQETLIAPANSTFHATREFVVRVGNAAGVSFLWNGKELPPQGAESEAKTFIFDAQGMRTLASDQTTH